MGEVNYPATLVKLNARGIETLDDINLMRLFYEELDAAVKTGECSPNVLTLTNAQKVELANHKMELEQQIIDLCSALDVEPVEVEE